MGKDEADDDLQRQKTRLELLKRKQKKYGSKVMLQKDYDLGSIAKDITDLDIFIAAIIARKADLS